MVIVGDKDPYSDLVLQAELFTNLGTSRGSVDRVWTILANADVSFNFFILFHC